MLPLTEALASGLAALLPPCGVPLAPGIMIMRSIQLVLVSGKSAIACAGSAEVCAADSVCSNGTLVVTITCSAVAPTDNWPSTVYVPTAKVSGPRTRVLNPAMVKVTL